MGPAREYVDSDIPAITALLNGEVARPTSCLADMRGVSVATVGRLAARIGGVVVIEDDGGQLIGCLGWQEGEVPELFLIAFDLALTTSQIEEACDRMLQALLVGLNDKGVKQYRVRARNSSEIVHDLATRYPRNTPAYTDIPGTTNGTWEYISDVDSVLAYLDTIYPRT